MTDKIGGISKSLRASPGFQFLTQPATQEKQVYGYTRKQMEDKIRQTLIDRDIWYFKLGHGGINSHNEEEIKAKYSGNYKITPDDFDYLVKYMTGMKLPPDGWYDTETKPGEIRDRERLGWTKTSGYQIKYIPIDTYLSYQYEYSGKK